MYFLNIASGIGSPFAPGGSTPAWCTYVPPVPTSPAACPPAGSASGFGTVPNEPRRDLGPKLPGGGRGEALCLASRGVRRHLVPQNMMLNHPNQTIPSCTVIVVLSISLSPQNDLKNDLKKAFGGTDFSENSLEKMLKGIYHATPGHVSTGIQRAYELACIKVASGYIDGADWWRTEGQRPVYEMVAMYIANALYSRSDGAYETGVQSRPSFELDCVFLETANSCHHTCTWDGTCFL